MLNRCVPHPHPQELRQFWISVHICGLQVWLLQIIPSPPDLELLMEKSNITPTPHQNIENLGILCGLQICTNLKSEPPLPIVIGGLTTLYTEGYRFIIVLIV